MKNFFYLFLLIIFFSCENDTKQASNLVNFIPKGAGVIVKIPDYQKFAGTLNDVALIKENEKLPFFSEVKQKLSFLNFLNLENPVLLNFSPEGKDEIVFSIITQHNPKLFSGELSQKKPDSISYGGHFIKKINFKGKESFYTSINDVFVLSDSKLIVENIIRQKDYAVPEDLLKAYNSSTGKTTSVLINHKNFEEINASLLPNNNFLNLENVAQWTAVDLEIENGDIKINGISTTESTSPQILDIFSNISALPTAIGQITPLNAEGFYTFTYHDFSVLKENLDDYHVNRAALKVENEDFFKLANEIGIISFKNEKALVVKSAAIIESQDVLKPISEEVNIFREVPIFKIENGNMFRETLSPLVTLKDLQYYFVINNFIVFAQEVETLELIIANFQNGTVLDHQEYFKEALSNISTESSILMVAHNKNFKEKVALSAAGEHQEELKKISFKEYPISALQFIRDSGFTHVHGILAKNAEDAASEGSVNQYAVSSLESNLNTKPMLFSNHYNGQKEVVVQDENEILYLISNSGKILWRKKIDGPVLGEIQMVDLFKNNKWQMAFATPKKFYVLDRNGNEVKPFPIEFKDPITQPLAVFDYSNNRDYRFVVAQDDDLLMYDANGKVVKGFEYKKSGGSIGSSPKHIRIGTKDYIVVTTANGQLNILDRQGDIRVPVKEKIDFSANEWYEKGNNFASTNANGDLVLISQTGEMKTEKNSLEQFHQIDMEEDLMVSISENILQINDKEIELDYGVFSEPEIFKMKNKSFISITDTQAHRVYLFTAEGNLLPNFPVYGNSTIGLANFDKDKNLEFVVQGEDDSLIFYEIN